MLKRLGLLLGLPALLAVIAGLWLWLPSFPAYRWATPAPLFGSWLAPGGRTLVAVHDDDSLTVWDVASGRLRARLPDVYHRRPNSPDFWVSPDGQLLAYPYRT